MEQLWSFEHKFPGLGKMFMSKALERIIDLHSKTYQTLFLGLWKELLDLLQKISCLEILYDLQFYTSDQPNKTFWCGTEFGLSKNIRELWEFFFFKSRFVQPD